MDEVDSIGSARTDNSGGGGDSEVQRTMLELLNQLDGFEATNKIKVGGWMGGRWLGGWVGGGQNGELLDWLGRGQAGGQRRQAGRGTRGMGDGGCAPSNRRPALCFG